MVGGCVPCLTTLSLPIDTCNVHLSPFLPLLIKTSLKGIVLSRDGDSDDFTVTIIRLFVYLFCLFVRFLWVWLSVCLFVCLFVYSFFRFFVC